MVVIARPAQTTVAALVAEDVTRLVGDRPIIADVSLRVLPGELIAVVGPNGAGKSTLCHLFAGDEEPSSGAVRLDGRPIGAWSTIDRARRRAVLPQHPDIAGAFPVLDIVLMGRHPWLRRHVGPSAVDIDIAEGAMAEVGVDHLATRPYPTLSGGEQARVHLARVLAQTTPVLLLDEPTASLDLRHQHVVASIARQRADAGVAVVAVLHDVALAAAYADRVVALSAGRVIAVGPPDEVLTATRLSAMYGHPVALANHPTQLWRFPAAERLTRTRCP